jgi:hypothetical protein
MPKSNGKRSSRRSRPSTVVTSLSASEKWDRVLANSKDTCRIVDRVTPFGLTTTTAGTPVSLFAPLGPFSTNGSVLATGIFGSRVASIAPNFTRFRVNRVLACWRPIVGTTTFGRVGLGFDDDPFGTTTISPTPTTVVTIDELRCSHTDSVYKDIEVEWRPVEAKTWYFVDATIAGSSADQRLEYPAALAVAADNTNIATQALGSVVLYYDLTFEGAIDSTTNP